MISFVYAIKLPCDLAKSTLKLTNINDFKYLQMCNDIKWLVVSHNDSLVGQNDSLAK